MDGASEDRIAQATLGGGCFWCLEAAFEALRGVVGVESGYAGGSVADPTYEQVCGGATGHAEVVQISFHPTVISYADLLDVFFSIHDATTLNRQGADVGTQYRSVIFYHNEEQKKLAEYYKKELDESGAFDAPIVTEIEPFKKYWPGESYHQNYFDQNRTKNPYCRGVIVPKIEKFEKVFKDKLKKKNTKPS